METVRKYLINEASIKGIINKVVNNWHKEQIKMAKKFEPAIKKAVASIDDIEGLENYRDNDLRNLTDINPELAYAVGDVVDQRIDQLMQEFMAETG